MNFSVCKNVCLLAAMTSIITLSTGTAQAGDKPAAKDKPIEAHAKVIVLKVDKDVSGGVSKALKAGLAGLPDAIKTTIEAELKSAMDKSGKAKTTSVRRLRVVSDRDVEQAKGDKKAAAGKTPITIEVEVIGDSIRVNGKPAAKKTPKQKPRIIKKRIETRLQQANASGKHPAVRHMILKGKEGLTGVMELIVEAKDGDDSKKPHAKHHEHAEHKQAEHHEHGEHHHGHAEHAKNAVKTLHPAKIQVRAIRIDGQKKPVAIAVKRAPHGLVRAQPQIAVHAAAGPADAHQQVLKELKAIENELKKIRQLLEKLNDDD